MKSNSQRIAALLAQAKTKQSKLLIPYVVAGDPTPKCSVEIMHALVAGGADIIELGMPFSDPETEGVDIQKAFGRVLASGTKMRDVLSMLAAFRERDKATPVILMGYLNPLLKMGLGNFTDAAKVAGADGLLIVNLPIEECAELAQLAASTAMDMIYLCAPTTTEQRLARISEQASGFLYYVSLRGTTGASHLNIDEVQERMAFIKARVDLPVVVGFGIKTPQTAAEVSKFADGVVVGAAIVRLIAEHAKEPTTIANVVRGFLLSLRRAIDDT